MPFPRQDPKPFVQERIERIRDGQKGCYGLYGGGEWIYIGSGDIKQRLLDHVRGDNPCLSRQRPTHWVDVVTADYKEREKRLIREYNPVCNQRVG